MQATAPADTQGITPYRSVFLPTDLQVDGLHAFAHALRFALDARASLTLLHVVVDETGNWGAFPGIRATLARWGALGEGADRRAVSELGIRARKQRVELQRPVRGILQHIEERQADLLVLMAREPTLTERWFRPALHEALASRAPVTALVLPNRHPGFVRLEDGRVQLRRVIVACPGRTDASVALRATERLLRSLKCDDVDIQLLHAPSSPVEAGSLERPGWRVTSVPLSGRRIPDLLRHAAEQSPDLIVVPTSLSLDRRWGRGSPVVQLLRQASHPVLLAAADR